MLTKTLVALFACTGMAATAFSTPAQQTVASVRHTSLGPLHQSNTTLERAQIKERVQETIAADAWVRPRLPGQLHESFKTEYYAQVKERIEEISPADAFSVTDVQPVVPERESQIELDRLPKHIAIILDGNRRYGKEKYNDGKRGHLDGSLKLTEMVNWCVQERIQALTVYIFSTENWNRDQEEVDAIMQLFKDYFVDLRTHAKENNVRVRFLSSDASPIPDDVKTVLDACAEETKGCDALNLNVCLSYGGRGEIVNACKNLAQRTVDGEINIDDISEDSLGELMMTSHGPEPDVLIRTSGEFRLSNFLLWQLAYTEFFFLQKHWPELEKEDLLDVIRTYANERKRRYGK